MYPWTNFYPMHFAPNEDPRAKEIPFHMKMNPNATLNSPYHQPWPYYPVPHEYHGCCNHSYFGGGPYSFRPPYPHYPPPPTLHTHGFYPPLPAGAYPPPPPPPPPHYSVEQPRYDYDKDNHISHHCCGYNHREDEKKPRIVPNVEKKTSESLVPLFLKDSPYPIMWAPSLGNMNSESKAKESEKKSRMERAEPEVDDKKTSESLVPLFLKDSPYPIMWVPPGNMNTESKAKENEKKSRIQRKEPQVDKKTSESLVPLYLKDSPYPIMWVPPDRYMNEESKSKDKDTKRGENGEGKHLSFPIFWVPSKTNDVGNETKDNNNLDLVSHKHLTDENKRHGSDGDVESEIRNKHVVQKVIPVKQVGVNEEKKSEDTKLKSDSVEKTDNGIAEEKASPKASKLPPVCLRIDPLPRKKKTSRSPSPPGVKDRSKSSQPETLLPENLKKEEEQSKGKIKTVMVTTDANKVEDNSLADPCEHIPKGEKGKVEEKKNLSEQEAALMIQSAYRGFEVRKSQPLTKLRQIGEVTKQAVEIRNRIQGMESSSSTIRINDKQKLIIGETIMSLLLKLDTIQGLHPIVRDVRKSVAKELVGLQEKLDSLTSNKSETPIVETVSSNKQDMYPEDDVIKEKSDQSDSNVTLVESGSGLSGNHGEDAKEFHDDGIAEAYSTNLEPQIELRKEESVGELNNEKSVDDVIQQKFDQELTQFDSTNEAKDSVGNVCVEVLDIKPEELVEHNTGELDSNQIQMLAETELRVDKSNQEKSDHVQAESDSAHEDVGLDTVILENHEAEAIDYVDNNGEGALDTKTEPLIEQNTGELNSDKHVETEQPLHDSILKNSDEMQAESGPIDVAMKSDTDICEHHEVESAESYHTESQQMESESQQIIIELTNQLEIPETEQNVKQEKPVQAEAKFESDIENVDSAEDFNVEDQESQDVSVMAEMNVELSKEDAMKGIQEGLIVPIEEAPMVDDVEILTEDVGETPPASPRRSHVTNGGDRKLMEENEKLRVAVEELLKAGNEQLGVIRDLTGKVKDLEKKLSKKNKKIKANKCRSRTFAVQDELSDCLV